MIWQHPNGELWNEDVLDFLAAQADESVQCVVTSPPYWGLRDYGIDGQMGLEPTPEEYVEKMVAVFAEARRVMRNDGTLWLNMGDAYATKQRGSDNGWDKSRLHNPVQVQKAQRAAMRPREDPKVFGLKQKDLVGMPWRLAFALQADGWWLRSDIIWSKPNPMPESVTDRPTKAHEFIFLMTKSKTYHYDADAIRESFAESSLQRIAQKTFDTQTGGEKDYGPNSNRSARKALENLKRRVPAGWATSDSYASQDPRYPKRDKQRGHGRRHTGLDDRWDAMPKVEQQAMGANKRTVWEIATQPYPDAHYATFPEKLVEPCILAGCPEGGIVMDPFAGSGTVGQVASRLGRRWLLNELNPDYCEQIKKRCAQVGMVLG